MKAAIIDRMPKGLSGEFSNEDIEARAEVIYPYVETQMQSACVALMWRFLTGYLSILSQ